MRIRGTFLKDYVELVQKSPELDWNRYLTADDWKIVNQMIIPTEWYPVGTMGRIGRGIFEMRTQKSYELVRLHGRARVDTAFDDSVKKFLVKNDPVSSLKSYVKIAGRFVDEIAVAIENSGEDWVEVSFFPVDDAPSWDLFQEIQAGTLERLIEVNGGKNPRGEIRTETRNGRECCLIRIRWDKA